MTKAANASKQSSATPKRVSRKRRSRASTAKNVRKAAAGWAGNDVEEIIAIVAATRSKSRF